QQKQRASITQRVSDSVVDSRNMCLLFLKFKQNAAKEEYSLILVSVRDEYYERPTKLAMRWKESEIIGAHSLKMTAQDMETNREGGTWIAVNTESGKIAVLLNILQRDAELNKRPRGLLVPDYLKNDASPQNHLENIAQIADKYNGFVLVCIQMNPSNLFEVCFFSNGYYDKPQALSPGVYAFGNSFNPDHPWPKVSYGKDRFEEVIDRHKTVHTKDALIADLFDMLSDRTQVELDEQMLKQGSDKTLFYMQRLNSLYVEIPEKKYGTRTWTIILIDGNKNGDFIERTMKEPIDCDGTKNIRKVFI
ncbi:hypothetical protein B4U79_05765, partial [Dinothrombium tinctorium]